MNHSRKGVIRSWVLSGFLLVLAPFQVVQAAAIAIDSLLVDTAFRIAVQRKSEPAPIIHGLLGIAEFLARESRTGEMA